MEWSKLLDYGFGGATLLVVGWVGLRLTAAIDRAEATVAELRDEVTAYSSRLNTLMDLTPVERSPTERAGKPDGRYSFRRGGAGGESR